MIQALQQPITFDEFVEWLPATSELSLSTSA